MTYEWFHSQTNLQYLCIECDIFESIDQFLSHLPLLKNLKVLSLAVVHDFNEQHFYEIISSLPSLEVKENNYKYIDMLLLFSTLDPCCS